MTFSGLYIISFLLISDSYDSKKINLGVIIGMILPDLDLLTKYINSNLLHHGMVFHSIISIFLLYLFLLIFNELNNKINIRLVNGVLIGMIIHVVFDILLSIGTILIFWPLPISSTIEIYRLEFNNNALYLIASIQFLCFRFLSHNLLSKTIESNKLSKETYNYIYNISRWIKIQTGILVLFISMYFIGMTFSFILMDICIFITTIMALYLSISIKELTTEDKIIG